jgi:RNA methyltransferase, TrmH family
MGAIFALPVARVTDPHELPGTRLGLAARTGAPLAAALADALAASTSTSTSGAADATILVGAERTGLPDDVLATCDATAHIPIATDSLNAAMAATVALYEAARIRAATGATRHAPDAASDPPPEAPAPDSRRKPARVGPS